MDIKEIRELLNLIENSAVEEFEMEKSGVRIRFRRSLAKEGPTMISTPAALNPTEPELIEQPPEKEKKEEELHLFTAPIVGTFYITPKPDAEPFVQTGDSVTKSTVLCIIEAMKIFNQIESDVEGEIVSILVENGQPVEYGEPLFQIRLSAEK